MNSIYSDFDGKRILVTGGTGFIGGKLVEELALKSKADVSVLVRNFARAVRVARLPITMITGDVTNPAQVAQAARGCDIIFHCAYGNSGPDDQRRLVTVEGTRNVLEAALRVGTERVVHLSSLMVYGVTPSGDLKESAPRRYLGTVYADSKLDAEELAFEYAERHGLPVVILQPTAVYGPFAAGWTVSVLTMLKKSRIILVNGGDGFANIVFIDDLVDAMLRAAVKKAAVGEAFLISSDHPVKWSELYGRYESMLGISSTVNMSAAAAKALYGTRNRNRGIIRETMKILQDEPSTCRRILNTRELSFLRKILRTYMPAKIHEKLKNGVGLSGPTEPARIVTQQDKPIHAWHPALVEFLAAKTRVCIDKAQKILGYKPAYDFDSGMKMTEKWARWANLLN
jgi:nucleoside-diphosphate-sugar epimerase